MVERRSLADGVTPPLPPTLSDAEKSFVYGPSGQKSEIPQAPLPATRTYSISREAIGTRIKTELVHALRRASLERQLQGQHPNSLQEILEEAVEPWLRANGYLK